MRKTHVTRQFFEARGHHSDLIEKTNKPLLNKFDGSMCAKFQVCIVFRLARPRINTPINKYTHTHKYASESKNPLDRLVASRGF